MSTSSFEELLQTARRALADGWVDEARYLYEMARAQQPDSPDAHYGLATAAFLLNDADRAVAHFQEVTRLDPLRAAAHVNLGAALTRLGQHGEAVEAIRKGIQLEPNRASGYYNLGLVYRAAGEDERALKALEQATKLDPRMADAHFNLGNLLMRQGQISRAAGSFRKTLELQPLCDKAAQALAQAEAALARPRETPVEANGSADKRLNPELDGPTLAELNRSVIAAQQAACEFLEALSADLAPTVRDLRMTLIASPDTSTMDLMVLGDRLTKMVGRVLAAHEQLQDHISQALAAGDRLPCG
jgi:tetratricopeptide (TPR) repeat protein